MGRLAGLASLAFLAACSQEDVNEAIGDFIKSLLWGFFKIILISLGLLVAWSAAAVIGGAFIALGVRRRKVDALAVLAILVGTACMVGAWPLVFSQDGLAGVLAPGSTGSVTAGPLVGQAAAVLGATVVAIVLVRRYRRKRTAAPVAPAVVPPEPPVVPPALEPLPTEEMTSVSAGGGAATLTKPRSKVRSTKRAPASKPRRATAGKRR